MPKRMRCSQLGHRSGSDVTRLAGAALFGWLVPPLLVLSDWLWTQGHWPCVGMECLGVLVLVAGLSGLCFGYLVGLIWGWPDGLVAFGAAILAAVTLFVPAEVLDSGDLWIIAYGYFLTASIGLVAVPFGILVRWLPPRLDLPWLGLVLGVVIIAVAVVGAATAPLGPYLGAACAIPILVAGVGTVLVGILSWLRRKQAGVSSS